MIVSISQINYSFAALVKSSSMDKIYCVNAKLPEGYDNTIVFYSFTCTCKGHRYNNSWCKHIDLVAQKMIDGYNVLPF
jgi:hypothetical protein